MLNNEIERMVQNKRDTEISDLSVVCDACGGDYPDCAKDCPLMRDSAK